MRAIRSSPSTFNMSALDLFASAMGAFMLISIVSLPFFPNTSDSVAHVASAQAELREAEADVEAAAAALQAAAAARQEAEEAERALLLPDLDLVIVLDITGSMRDEIDNLQRELQALMLILDRLAPTFAIGVVTFTDREVTPITTEFPLTVVTGRPDARDRAQRFFDEIVLDRTGHAFPEAVLDGLRLAGRMPFRSEAEQRLIVLITDAIPYDEEYDDCIAFARTFAAGPTQSVSAVSIPLPAGIPAAAREPAEASSRRFLTELAAAGGGRMQQSETSVMAAILELIL